MADIEPVFYDCEASALEGFPIEIGWASVDSKAELIACESHLIRPPQEWPIEEVWDPAAQQLHGITLARLRLDGRSVREVAERMNGVLAGRELFSDDLHDEAWLRLLFDAAGFDPAFTIRKMDARILISSLASDRGVDAAAYAQAKARAAEFAPRRHRAEADARHLAVLWNILVRGPLAP